MDRPLTASSINTGYVDPKMRIEIRLQSKYGHEFMPNPWSSKNTGTRYLNVQILRNTWTDDDQLHKDNFQMLLEDLKGWLTLINLLEYILLKYRICLLCGISFY
jgi:hypothetical protein